VKIGWSARPWKRIPELRTMSPVELRPIGFRVGSERDEATIHHQFRELHCWGEWFFLLPSLQTYIAENVVLCGDDWEACATKLMTNVVFDAEQ